MGSHRENESSSSDSHLDRKRKATTNLSGSVLDDHHNILKEGRELIHQTGQAKLETTSEAVNLVNKGTPPLDQPHKGTGYADNTEYLNSLKRLEEAGKRVRKHIESLDNHENKLQQGSHEEQIDELTHHKSGLSQAESWAFQKHPHDLLNTLQLLSVNLSKNSYAKVHTHNIEMEEQVKKVLREYPKLD